jgi:hypothetical protein
MTPMQAIDTVTDKQARSVLLLLAAEHAQFRGRLIATAGVPCVKDASWKRWPMKCLPNDPCSFCRAREALRGVDESNPTDGLWDEEGYDQAVKEVLDEVCERDPDMADAIAKKYPVWARICANRNYGHT